MGQDGNILLASIPNLQSTNNFDFSIDHHLGHHKQPNTDQSNNYTSLDSNLLDPVRYY